MQAVRVHESGACLLGALESGSWRPVVDTVLPLTAAALEQLESGRHFGKIVLAVQP